MLELYHHGSSVCAAKVRLALAEKGLAWSGHYIDLLKGEQFAESFLKINPRAMVPVLVHDGKIVLESTVICEYVEEVFPERPIYPCEPWLRAQARLWTKAVDEDLHPACSAITYVVSHRHAILRNGKQQFADFINSSTTESVESRKLKWQWIEHGLAAPGIADKIRLYDRYLLRMEQALSGGAWLCGDAFSVADIALTPYVNRLAMLGMEGMWQNGRRPRVEEWFARIQSRPTFTPALLAWIPADLTQELRSNGTRSWPEVERIVGLP